MHDPLIIVLEIVGASVALVRLWPSLREALIALQVAYTVMQFANLYLKYNPEKKKDIANFWKQVMHHYYTTHPHGKELAKDTQMDEKGKILLNSLDRKEKQLDLASRFYGFFGIKPQ